MLHQLVKFVVHLAQEFLDPSALAFQDFNSILEFFARQACVLFASGCVRLCDCVVLLVLTSAAAAPFSSFVAPRHFVCKRVRFEFNNASVINS